MTYSAKARRNLLATSADEPFLVALEITHPDLAVPVRVVNDSQAVTIQGDEFIACPFQLTLPDDVDQQVPKARLSVDNIGRDLTQWLEVSGGGKGAKCRILQVVPSDPDIIEYDMMLDLTGLAIDNMAVSGDLGFQETLNQAAVGIRYDPISAPGLW
tara:strand:- start:1009 stop:1479 length:471 start_codon:yes stop_codon:yes gene_type:complete